MRLFWVMCVVFVTGFFLFSELHEEAHVQVFRNDGVDAHIEYLSHFPDMVTVGDEPCRSMECELGHSVNEVVGYHLISFYWLVGLGLLCIVGAVEARR